MPTCRNCGSHASRAMARVFGDDHDRLFACLDCETKGGLINGAGADPDRERRASWTPPHLVDVFGRDR